MARPRKEGMDYFPHDTNATNDKKIEIMRMLYGNDGYAFYFILCELIYQEPNFELDVSDAETIQILAKKVEVSEDKFIKMMETSIKRDLFDREEYELNSVLTSNGIKKRAGFVVEKRERMREKYSKTKENGQAPVSAAETPEETPQSKVKKSKSKEKKSINKIHYAEFVSLSEDEYLKLVQEYGQEMTDEMIDVLNTYKGANGKTYKSDYLATKNWVVERVMERRNKPARRGTNVTHIEEGRTKTGKANPTVSDTPKGPEMSPEDIASLYELAERMDAANG